MAEITPTELAFGLIRKYCSETGVSIEIANTNDYFQLQQANEAELLPDTNGIFRTPTLKSQQRLIMTPTGFREEPSGKEFSETTTLLELMLSGYHPPLVLANLRLIIVSIELDYVLRSSGITLSEGSLTTATKAMIQI